MKKRYWKSRSDQKRGAINGNPRTKHTLIEPQWVRGVLMPAVIRPGMQTDEVVLMLKKGKGTQASCLEYAHCSIIKHNPPPEERYKLCLWQGRAVGTQGMTSSADQHPAGSACSSRDGSAPLQDRLCNPPRPSGFYWQLYCHEISAFYTFFWNLMFYVAQSI